MRLALCTVAALLGGCAPNAPPQEFDGARAYGYVEAQMEFGPRIPGTEGHRRAGDWILEHLQGRADTVLVQSFTHVSVAGDSLPLRNFIGRFRPEAARRVLYLAHWDTRPRADQSATPADRQRPVPGANDGASGVAVLLGVADALAAGAPDAGVDLVFVDGEDYGDFGLDRDVLLGSRYFADNLPPGADYEYAVVWDMVGDRDLGIYKEGNSVVAAPDVVDRVWATARRVGHGDYFLDEVRYTIDDDHVSLHAVGIKAIDVIDFVYPYWHTPEDTADKVSAKSLQIVGDVAMALLR